MRKTTKKLSLDRQTVRTLVAAEQAAARGAQMPPCPTTCAGPHGSDSCNCPSANGCSGGCPPWSQAPWRC